MNLIKRIVSILIILLIVSAVGVAQIIPSLPAVQAPANLDALCEVYRSIEYMVGPNCLNPVMWDMDGFIHIGAIVSYRDDSNVERVGRVAGYAWHRDEERYYYLLERFDNVVNEYATIAPERVIP